MNGLVSIIVPIYRAEAYIADTIAMVVRQTYTEWELLLIDDCSPDGSTQVVRDMLREHKWSLRSSVEQDDKETEQGEVRSVGNKGIRTVEVVRMCSGLAGSGSSFSRRRRMCTSTVRNSPIYS